MSIQRTAQPETVDRKALAHDLSILEDMVAHMGGYLMTEATRWDVGKSGAPPITIGGYLMRRRRLGLLSDLLDEDERHRVAVANTDYEGIIARQTVRFEARVMAEIGARMREWAEYLRNLAVSKRLSADHAHYIWKSDTRVVIAELLDAFGPTLPGHVTDDVAMLDRRLQARWEPGAFIWATMWLPAYPAERFWWLYGYPAAH